MTDELKNDQEDAPKGERIAKALARAGVGSRRDVERMIEAGRVTINGKTLDTAATVVSSLQGIKVDGEAVETVSETKLWRFHKRRGTLTTHKDPEGRPTVFDKLPDHVGRVIAVGRLDMNTEGLLLLTNDGELARWLELPANEHIRRYRVRVHGHVDEKALKKLEDGATIDGIHYGKVEARLEKTLASNAWVTVAIREGKNREVRRLMEHLGLVVNRLIRTHYGPFTLGSLPDGGVGPVGEKQLHDVLADYFKTARVSVGEIEKKQDTSKWAKPKAKPVKPGMHKRRKFMGMDETEAAAHGFRKPRAKDGAGPDAGKGKAGAGKPARAKLGLGKPVGGKPVGGKPFGGKPLGGKPKK